MNERSCPSGRHAKPVTVEIRAPSGWPDLELIEVWRHLQIIYILAVRDIKVRYKQSLVGVGWVVVQPHCSRHSSRSEPLKDSMNAFVAL
ncbi:MAG TPA: hypothetical protein VI338_05265, partial [Nitrososphaera sp.]|nr:hypothetical protein [Nitrososphaera sp.]